MSRTIYIVGNDGSGKTTFARRFKRIGESRGLRIRHRHYHSTWVRRVLRDTAAWLFQLRKRKFATRSTEQPGGGVAPPDGERVIEYGRWTKGLRKLLIIPLLWVYQTAMGVELRLRDWFSPSDVIVIERSYVDDIVSICEVVRVEASPALIRWCARVFPVRRMFFLTAGSEVEYARMTDVDQSLHFHRRKSERYLKSMDVLVRSGVPVRQVDTSGGDRGRPSTQSRQEQS